MDIHKGMANRWGIIRHTEGEQGICILILSRMAILRK